MELQQGSWLKNMFGALPAASMASVLAIDLAAAADGDEHLEHTPLSYVHGAYDGILRRRSHHRTPHIPGRTRYTIPVNLPRTTG